MARCSSCGLTLDKAMKGTCWCGQKIVKKTLLPRIFKKKKSNSITVKNSSISGDVIADATNSSDSQGNTIELTNSNIVGDLIQNNVDVDEIIEKFSILLDEKVFNQSSSEVTDEKREQLFEEVLVETKKEVDELDDVMLKISSLRKISRAANKAGYRKKATQIDIEVAEILANQDDWETKISGYIKLSELYSRWDNINYKNMNKAEKYAKDAVEICDLKELKHLERKVELNLVEVLRRSLESYHYPSNAKAIRAWQVNRENNKHLLDSKFSASRIKWNGIQSLDDWWLGKEYVRAFTAGHLNEWYRKEVKKLIKIMRACEYGKTIASISERRQLYEDLWQLRLGDTIFFTGVLMFWLMQFLLLKPIGLVITLSTIGVLYLIL